MQTVNQNPLKQYFRQYKLYTKLPSGTTYYPDGSVTFTDTGEIGIMPMTGKDELILKNPDALLNGQALIEVISSCVPAVKDPKKLLKNDIDALITAIRLATFNDKLETEIRCPNCGHENMFKLDLQYALDNMEYLEPDYVVHLDSGLSIFVRPYGFQEILKGLHMQFEQTKLTRAIESQDLSEEARLKLLSEVFQKMSVITYELLLNSIIRVVDERNSINVSDRAFIQDFLQNIDKKSLDAIKDLVEEINGIGIKTTFTAKCQNCEHTWENDIDFNPVNFS